MRRFISTIVLVLVLAGLAGYIYFIDSKEESGASDKEKVFGSVKADEIEEIQVKSADGDHSRLQKSDGKWQLVEPVKAAADEGEASSLASSLASLEVNRVVDENAASLAEYGLEPARLEVAFKKKGDSDGKDTKDEPGAAGAGAADEKPEATRGFAPMVDAAIGRVLRTLSIPTRDEVEAIGKRINELSRSIEARRR